MELWHKIETAEDVLLITDGEGPVGMAGVMGGLRTSVSPETTDVFFEVAYFTPSAIAGRGRRWGLVTDASQRYERGVDPTLPVRAIERATRLLLEMVGGEPGPTQLTTVGGTSVGGAAGTGTDGGPGAGLGRHASG